MGSRLSTGILGNPGISDIYRAGADTLPRLGSGFKAVSRLYGFAPVGRHPKAVTAFFHRTFYDRGSRSMGRKPRGACLLAPSLGAIPRVWADGQSDMSLLPAGS